MVGRYILELVVFASGAIVMVYELVGSRLISPYAGTSIYVWTSLIGVILGALSLGYHLGGKLADKKAEWYPFSAILFFAALFIGVTGFVSQGVLGIVEKFGLRSEYTALIASVFLFAPASLALGMVSPYSVKLRMANLETSASTVGNLYALSTIGSIVGTFSAGFFLIPFIGSTRILFILAIVLLFLSIITCRKAFTAGRVILLAAFACMLPFGDIPLCIGGKGNVQIDTPYNRVWIEYKSDEESGKQVVALYTDPFNEQAAMFIDSDELVFRYTRFFRVARHFNPDIMKTLMIGGCVYSYARDFLNAFPASTMDVVEIDPGMTKIARKYFRLRDDDRLTIFHEDARTYLNRTREKYDVIYSDAFNSFLSVPYQLATREAVGKMYGALNDNGIVIQNIISAINGKRGEFLRAEIATYRQFFPQVFIFRVNKVDSHEDQSIILVAMKNGKKPAFTSEDQELNTYLECLWKEKIPMDMPVITDDHAPVEYYKLRSL
ncbi:MAG: fused MFS/spermidine synthase [Syntrophorhabdaceae bacterium]